MSLRASLMAKQLLLTKAVIAKIELMARPPRAAAGGAAPMHLPWPAVWQLGLDSANDYKAGSADNAARTGRATQK